MIDVDDYYTVLLLQSHAREAALDLKLNQYAGVIELRFGHQVNRFDSVEEALGFCRGWRAKRGDFKGHGTISSSQAESCTIAEMALKSALRESVEPDEKFNPENNESEHKTLRTTGPHTSKPYQDAVKEIELKSKLDIALSGKHKIDFDHENPS